jgi:hypothetical protein
MTLDDAKAIVSAYQELLAHAINTLRISGHQGDVNADTAKLDFADEGKPGIWWHEYESDYYGGGYLAERRADVDPRLLCLSAEDLEKEIDAVEAHEKERAAKVEAALEAIRRDREKAQELAMFVKLTAKYGHLTEILAEDKKRLDEGKSFDWAGYAQQKIAERGS